MHMEKTMRTIVLAFSTLALLPLTACGSSETNNGTTSEAPAAPALAIGETGKANGIEIAVTSVKSTNQVADPSAVPLAGPDETYVVVKYTIKNTSAAPLEVQNRPTIDLLDANGQSFAKDDIATGVAGAMLDAQGMVNDINPGVTVKAAAVWKVAKQGFDLGTWKVVVRTDPALEFKLK